MRSEKRSSHWSRQSSQQVAEVAGVAVKDEDESLDANLLRAEQEAVLEHLEALEAFLDTSILAGFSFGADKAEVVVTTGTLLGYIVSRTGARPDGERTQAIRDFAPLTDATQVR